MKRLQRLMWSSVVRTHRTSEGCENSLIKPSLSLMFQLLGFAYTSVIFISSRVRARVFAAVRLAVFLRVRDACVCCLCVLAKTLRVVQIFLVQGRLHCEVPQTGEQFWVAPCNKRWRKVV